MILVIQLRRSSWYWSTLTGLVLILSLRASVWALTSMRACRIRTSPVNVLQYQLLRRSWITRIIQHSGLDGWPKHTQRKRKCSQDQDSENKRSNSPALQRHDSGSTPAVIQYSNKLPTNGD